jgi:hypothetical protein
MPSLEQFMSYPPFAYDGKNNNVICDMFSAGCGIDESKAAFPQSTAVPRQCAGCATIGQAADLLR